MKFHDFKWWRSLQGTYPCSGRDMVMWLGSCFVFFDIPNGFIKWFFETCLMPLQIGELCQITFVEPQSLTYCIIIHKLYNYKLYIIYLMYLDVINQWSTNPLGVCFFHRHYFWCAMGWMGSFISSLPHYLKALGAVFWTQTHLLYIWPFFSQGVLLRALKFPWLRGFPNLSVVFRSDPDRILLNGGSRVTWIQPVLTRIQVEVA